MREKTFQRQKDKNIHTHFNIGDPRCAHFNIGEPLCGSPSELSQLVESLPELCTELRLPFSTLLLRPLCRCSIDLDDIEEVRLGTSGGTLLLPADDRDDLPPPPPPEPSCDDDELLHI